MAISTRGPPCAEARAEFHRARIGGEERRSSRDTRRVARDTSAGQAVSPARSMGTSG